MHVMCLFRGDEYIKQLFTFNYILLYLIIFNYKPKKTHTHMHYINIIRHNPHLNNTNIQLQERRYDTYKRDYKNVNGSHPNAFVVQSQLCVSCKVIYSMQYFD